MQFWCWLRGRSSSNASIMIPEVTGDDIYFQQNHICLVQLVSSFVTKKKRTESELAGKEVEVLGFFSGLSPRIVLGAHIECIWGYYKRINCWSVQFLDIFCRRKHFWKFHPRNFRKEMKKKENSWMFQANLITKSHLFWQSYPYPHIISISISIFSMIKKESLEICNHNHNIHKALSLLYEKSET